MARVGLPKKWMKWAWKQAAKDGSTKKAKSDAFKAAWRKFRGKKKGTKRAGKTSRKSNPKKRGRRKMGRRKKRRGGKSMTRTAFKLIRLGALVANPIRIAMIPNVDPSTKITWAFQDYTGYNIQDGSFKFERMARGWGPYLMACAATYGIPKLVSIIRRL